MGNQIEFHKTSEESRKLPLFENQRNENEIGDNDGCTVEETNAHGEDDRFGPNVQKSGNEGIVLENKLNAIRIKNVHRFHGKDGPSENVHGLVEVEDFYETRSGLANQEELGQLGNER